MKISADPDNVQATGMRLGTYADGCESVASRVHPTQLSGMPPQVAAVVFGRLSNVHRDLQRGRNELQDVSIEARRRAVMMRVAGDGASKATLSEIAAISAASRKYGGMTAMGLAIGGAQAYGRAAGSVPVQAFNSIVGLPGAVSKKLDAVGDLLKRQGGHPLSKIWGQNALVRGFHRASHALTPITKPLGRILKPLNVVANVRQIVSTYQHTSGPVWARVTETAVKNAGMVATKFPPLLVLDLVTDGAVSHGGELVWAATGAFGDTTKFDAYSDHALAGQYGHGVQNVARFGHWLGYDVIGGAIYGPDPTPQGAGAGGGGGGGGTW